LKSGYFFLSFNKDFSYSKQLPPENSNVLSTLLETGWGMGGQQIIMLMNYDFRPSTVWCNNCAFCNSVNIRILKARENVAKIEDKVMVKLWNNDHVYHRKLPVP
jgi:hypothetical protein